jgi:hypothetical protein
MTMTGEEERTYNNAKAAAYRERIRAGQPIGMRAAAFAARPPLTEEDRREKNRARVARHRERVRGGQPINKQLHGGVQAAAGFDQISATLGISERETRNAYASAIKKLRKHGRLLVELLHREHVRWPIMHP